MRVRACEPWPKSSSREQVAESENTHGNRTSHADHA
jgi:hypothetical protein